MVIVASIAETHAAIGAQRANGGTVAFVPTMGALHAGHLSLVERARAEADCVVMSIFVNPLQFGPNEDLARYPRPVEDDERMASEAGVDILFRPTVDEMYPGHRTITVTAGDLGASWEGASRPGHFDGVLTVVAKLLNIVYPQVAVFGRKDLQQAALVQAMVRDLNIPSRVVMAPIVREFDGVAMSSRNRYLDEADRQRARVLSAAVREVRAAFARGTRDTRALEAEGNAVLASEPDVRPDYFAVINPTTFLREEKATADFAAIVAARVGKTRLLDNLTIGGNDQD